VFALLGRVVGEGLIVVGLVVILFGFGDDFGELFVDFVRVFIVFVFDMRINECKLISMYFQLL
jgi:hypothetical protein